MPRIRTFAVATAVVALATLAGCGGGSSAPSTTTLTTAEPNGSNVAGATAAVTQLYEHFFQTPPSQVDTMLQDGSSLSKAIAIANRVKGSATESAKVQSVKFINPTTASVSYSLSTNGTVVLPNATGQAVYVDGKWLFAKITFCTLVGLAQPGKPVSGC